MVLRPATVNKRDNTFVVNVCSVKSFLTASKQPASQRSGLTAEGLITLQDNGS